MKVKDLIALLKEYDEEAEVVLQSDQEGNGYQELRGADEDSYLFDGDDASFLSQYNNIDDMAEDLGEDVYDLLGSLNDVVVLYP